MKHIACLLFVVLMIPVSAFANDLTLFGGFQKPGELTLSGAVTEGATTTQKVFSDPFNVGIFGLRFGHGNVWGGEHTIAYAPNFLDSESKALVYNSNFMLQTPTPFVKGYGTAGLGTFIVKGDGLTDIGSKFAINYGGGLKVLPAGPVGLRIDVRGYTLPSVQDQTLNIVEVSLGILFSF